MHRKQSIYSKRCWLEGELRPGTITFVDGLITEIRSDRSAYAMDAGTDIIMPGVIDAHVHVNEPGRTEWEGFESATMAAAAGGITTIADMPLNSSPVTTSVKAFNEKIAASISKLHINCTFYGGLIPGNEHEMGNLIRANVSGIKCFLTHSGIDEFPNVRLRELEVAMPVIAKSGIPLLVHCELSDSSHDSINDPGSYKEYLASRPAQWENNAISMMIGLCEKYKCVTHIVHVSSAEALGMIREAKKKGLPLTAETCAHYIYFDAEHIPDNNTLYKCAPPIRNAENNDALKDALKNGVLDFITTDHSPAPPSIKEIESGNLRKAWGGIAGLQFLLPVSWTALKDSFSLEEFIPLLTNKPARFLHLADRKGTLKPGYDADMVVWRPDEVFVVKEKDILHRHKASPYTGEHLSGTVQQTFVNGEVVFDRNSTVKRSHYGKVILNNTV